jgi:hypothetical protein
MPRKPFEYGRTPYIRARSKVIDDNARRTGVLPKGVWEFKNGHWIEVVVE